MYAGGGCVVLNKLLTEHRNADMLKERAERLGCLLARLCRLDEAVHVFKKSLTEHRNADTLN